jgi:hypothetical protein
MMAPMIFGGGQQATDETALCLANFRLFVNLARQQRPEQKSRRVLIGTLRNGFGPTLASQFRFLPSFFQPGGHNSGGGVE